MGNKALLLKVLAVLLALASAACFAAPAVVKWTLLQGRALPDDAAAIGVIGGADGPTAVFITAGPAGFSFSDSCGTAGGLLAAGAVGLWLLARAFSRRKGG